MYYRGANAALLLYDITNQASFQDVRGWLKGEPRQAPVLIYPKIPSQLINSLLVVPRTQEELSGRLDHIHRRFQGRPFPPSTSLVRSCAPLPPSVVPTASATAASSPATSALGILLHPSSLYVLHVDQIRSTDRVSPAQTLTYRFPFEQLGYTTKPRWSRSAMGTDRHPSERQPLDRHVGTGQR